MGRILIVEDEPAIAELVLVNLRHSGFRPTWAMDGSSAQREIDAALPDLILLDWMLPGDSGLELAKRWRPEVASGFKKAQAHTALADVHESIDELVYYREHFLKMSA